MRGGTGHGHAKVGAAGVDGAWVEGAAGGTGGAEGKRPASRCGGSKWISGI